MRDLCKVCNGTVIKLHSGGWQHTNVPSSWMANPHTVIPKLSRIGHGADPGTMGLLHGRMANGQTPGGLHG